MDNSLHNLRSKAILAGKPKELVNRSNKKQLCEMLNLPTTKAQKFKLTNLITGEVTTWESIYQLRKRYKVNEANFFWYLKTGNPMRLDGVLYTIEKIGGEERLETVEEEDEEWKSNLYRRMPASWSNDDDLIRWDRNGDMIGFSD